MPTRVSRSLVSECRSVTRGWSPARSALGNDTIPVGAAIMAGIQRVGYLGHAGLPINKSPYLASFAVEFPAKGGPKWDRQHRAPAGASASCLMQLVAGTWMDRKRPPHAGRLICEDSSPGIGRRLNLRPCCTPIQGFIGSIRGITYNSIRSQHINLLELLA
ncbi:hypothetical protein D3C81_1020100 [compost metagenome]